MPSSKMCMGEDQPTKSQSKAQVTKTVESGRARGEFDHSVDSPPHLRAIMPRTHTVAFFLIRGFLGAGGLDSPWGLGEFV